MRAIKFKLLETNRERATVEDRCKSHTGETNLVHEWTDRRENIEIGFYAISLLFVYILK